MMMLASPASTMYTSLPHHCTILRSVTAVMGPSGAGKTTFMTVLMGKVPRTSGTLYINGAQEEMYRYRKMIGFVPQVCGPPEYC